MSDRLTNLLSTTCAYCCVNYTLGCCASYTLSPSLQSDCIAWGCLSEMHKCSGGDRLTNLSTYTCRCVNYTLACCANYTLNIVYLRAVPVTQLILVHARVVSLELICKWQKMTQHK